MELVRGWKNIKEVSVKGFIICMRTRHVGSVWPSMNGFLRSRSVVYWTRIAIRFRLKIDSYENIAIILKCLILASFMGLIHRHDYGLLGYRGKGLKMSKYGVIDIYYPRCKSHLCRIPLYCCHIYYFQLILHGQCKTTLFQKNSPPSHSRDSIMF